LRADPFACLAAFTWSGSILLLVLSLLSAFFAAKLFTGPFPSVPFLVGLSSKERGFLRVGSVIGAG